MRPFDPCLRVCLESLRGIASFLAEIRRKRRPEKPSPFVLFPRKFSPERGQIERSVPRSVPAVARHTVNARHAARHLFPAHLRIKGGGFQRRCDLMVAFHVNTRISYTCRSAVRWPRGLRRRFAKAARDHRTGLKSSISGPFFIGNLVGVGCRMMVVGPRLGTLVGTLEPMPMCAL
jgi:hypothetical protein